MIEQLPQSTGQVLGFQLSGKLHDADYQSFVPVIDTAIAQHGKIRLLAWFHEFEGWDTHALWDDTRFATLHCTEIERIALVGEKRWEAWMAMVCRPFSMAKIEYFDVADLDGAWKWLNEDLK